MTTTPLFDRTLAPLDIGEAAEFHRKNPQVYQAFVARALELRRRGVEHYGAKAIFEVLRFHSLVDGRGPGEARKLNNSYTPFYARLAMHNEPELRGFFRTRNHE